MPSKNRDHRARWERRKAKERATPLNVKYASKLGPAQDKGGGTGWCETCGEKLSFDTSNGGLVALNHGDRDLHRHQPPPPDMSDNRQRVAAGACTVKYGRAKTKTRPIR